jgi:hypothetical protein
MIPKSEIIDLTEPMNQLCISITDLVHCDCKGCEIQAFCEMDDKRVIRLKVIQEAIKDLRGTLHNELRICMEDGDAHREDTAMILYINKKFDEMFKAIEEGEGKDDV